jgi:hypothetical protein
MSAVVTKVVWIGRVNCLQKIHNFAMVSSMHAHFIDTFYKWIYIIVCHGTSWTIVQQLGM